MLREAQCLPRHQVQKSSDTNASSDTNVVLLFFPSQKALFDNSSLFYSPGVWDQLKVAKNPQEKAGLSKAGGRERLCLLQTDRLSLAVFRDGFIRLPVDPGAVPLPPSGCSAGRSLRLRLTQPLACLVLPSGTSLGYDPQGPGLQARGRGEG